MNTTRRQLLFWTVAATATGGTLNLRPARGGGAASKATIGSPAPTFEVRDASGRIHTLT